MSASSCLPTAVGALSEPLSSLMRARTASMSLPILSSRSREKCPVRLQQRRLTPLHICVYRVRGVHVAIVMDSSDIPRLFCYSSTTASRGVFPAEQTV